jgi:hypothetical protein
MTFKDVTISSTPNKKNIEHDLTGLLPCHHLDPDGGVNQHVLGTILKSISGAKWRGRRRGAEEGGKEERKKKDQHPEIFSVQEC